MIIFFICFIYFIFNLFLIMSFLFVPLFYLFIFISNRYLSFSKDGRIYIRRKILLSYSITI